MLHALFIAGSLFVLTLAAFGVALVIGLCRAALWADEHTPPPLGVCTCPRDDYWMRKHLGHHHPGCPKLCGRG